MVLAGMQVRRGEPGDVPELVALLLEARAESSVGPQLCSGDAEQLETQLRTFAAAEGSTVLVALADDVVVGMLLSRIIGPGPFTTERAVHVEAVFVSAEHRRRGLGHALLGELLTIAEEAGAEHVVAAPLPGARGMQRFLARLGFAPAASFRFSTLAALRRRLAERSASAVGLVRGRGLERLIALRRVSSGAGRRAATADQEDQRAESSSMQVSRAVQTRRPSSSVTTIS